jgi:hypothetical protein
MLKQNRKSDLKLKIYNKCTLFILLIRNLHDNDSFGLIIQDFYYIIYIKDIFKI